MPAHAPQKGTLPVLQYCLPDQLQIDPTYQRDLDGRSHQLIAQIARDWDWNLFQPLVVARRHDGRLFVVDGQHRLAAARLRGDVPQLPSVIFHPADPADEASVFVKLNQQRRPLSPFALYNAALASGDEQAIALDGIMRQAGLVFAGTADAEALKPGQINITGRVRRWHARNGDAATRATLARLAKMVRTNGARHCGILFAGIGAVAAELGDSLNGLLFDDVLDRPIAEWVSDFHDHAARESVGIEAAAVAVIGAAYADARREADADDTPAPAAPEPPRGPADPRTRGPAKIDLRRAPSSMEERATGWSGRN